MSLNVAKVQQSKEFVAEIKKTQQLLRLDDTPPSLGLPAISSWVGETWHSGGGDKLESCSEEKTPYFFFWKILPRVCQKKKS